MPIGLLVGINGNHPMAENTGGNPMFEWNRHKTLEKATAELEDLFATGQVCEGERPFIGSVYVPGYGKRYIIYVGHDEE